MRRRFLGKGNVFSFLGKTIHAVDFLLSLLVFLLKKLDFLDINKELWNNKVEVHIASEFYDMPSFREGKTSLRGPEIALLGDIRGQTLLHLQCHFGQDTLSLARMGAQVTGVDFSDKAIASAKQISEDLAIPAKFVCCDIYSLPKHLEGQFDIVFTSYGTIGWLPDLEKWASIVSHFLKPGGRLVMVDFHPVVWMFDDAFSTPSYGYFNTGPIIEQEHGTYADKSADLHHESHGWNHSTAELLGSLLNKGLTLKHFHEYDYSAYSIFTNSVQIGEHRFQVKGHEGKLPLMYSVVFEK